MSSEIKNSFSYIPALDGLRAAAVALVILAHYGLGHVVPGGLGVTVFFFLSGFLITRLLLAERAATGGGCIRNFYVRRFLRLYIAYGWADEDYTYEASEMRMESILYGVMLATLVELPRGRRLIVRVLTHWSALCGGIAVLGASVLLRDEFFRATVRYSVQGLALMPVFAVLAFGGAARLGVLMRWILAHRLTVAFGRISYPLYLWHNTCHLVVAVAL